MTSTLTTICPYCETPLAVYGSLLVCRNLRCVNLDKPMTRSDIDNVPEIEGQAAIDRSLR